MAIFIVERLLQDEDTLGNGVVYIQECSGMGMKHVKQYKLNEMLKYIDVFWVRFKYCSIYFTRKKDTRRLNFSHNLENT